MMMFTAPVHNLFSFWFNTTKYLFTLHFCLVATDCIIFLKGFSLSKTFCSLQRTLYFRVHARDVKCII